MFPFYNKYHGRNISGSQSGHMDVKPKMNKFANPARHLIFTLLLGFPFWNLSGQTTDKSGYTGDLPDTGEGIVASVGTIEISSTEFLANYQFGPAFFKRKTDARNRYLNTMIHEKLLALDGYEKKLEQNASVKRALQAYRDDIITEELYKDTIMSKITVSDEEIESWLPEARKQIDLAWIYAVDEESSYALWKQLSMGSSFDSLFKKQLTDSLQESDRTLSSTIYKLRSEQPEVFAVIVTLPLEVILNQFRGRTVGIYLRSAISGRRWYLPESEEYKLKHELERSLFKNKLDVESDIYVKNLMDRENPVIDKDGFFRIVLYLNSKAVTHKPFDEKILKNKLNSDQTDDVNQILVTGKTIQIKTTDFADWYSPRAVYLKMPSDSPENFILTAQRIVWRMVRDYVLIKEAKRKGYENLPNVIVQTAWWQDKIVYNAIKAEIANSVKYDENDLRNYYTDNLKNFTYASGEIIPYEKARKNVESELRKEIYMNRLMRRVLDLKQKYAIEINENLLGRLNLDDEGDPDTIDFYAVKKGGLLPRQPYPTIDWDWQLWY